MAPFRGKTTEVLDEDSWLSEVIVPNEMEVHYANKKSKGKLPSDILQEVYGVYHEDGIDLYDEGNIR